MGENQIVKTLIELGKRFKNITEEKKSNDEVHLQSMEVMQKASVANPWFTSDNLKLAFKSLGNALKEEKVKQWLSAYVLNINHPKRVGIIMAGNIPMVGFHDLITVLVSGNIAVCKFSSKDFYLMDFVISQLKEIQPNLDERIEVVEKLKGVDAVIATGSNNSMRYFEYYFSKIPHLFRSNRTSIAVLDGSESDADMELLADDIFQYFGLGCRNVTKLYIPEDFDLDRIFKGVYHKSHIAQHHKYSNNYDYNKSIFLLNKEPLLENGFMLLKEDEGMFTPVSVLFYERYSDKEKLKIKVIQEEKDIQCIVSRSGMFENEVSFGKSQHPELWDYADKVDTMNFLTELDS